MKQCCRCGREGHEAAECTWPIDTDPQPEVPKEVEDDEDAGPIDDGYWIA